MNNEQSAECNRQSIGIQLWTKDRCIQPLRSHSLILKHPSSCPSNHGICITTKNVMPCDKCAWAAQLVEQRVTLTLSLSLRLEDNLRSSQYPSSCKKGLFTFDIIRVNFSLLGVVRLGKADVEPVRQQAGLRKTFLSPFFRRSA